MKKIRFGITGSGYMGRTHAEAIRRLGERAKLVAVWGGTRAPGLAEHYGAVCETDLDTFMRRWDIDAVIVATPHHRHVVEAVQALHHGKHVLVEKPMATSVADCDGMIQAASSRGLVLAVGYTQRFRSNCARARDLIAENAIGRILTIQLAMGFDMASFKAGGFGSTWGWWEDSANIGYLINSLPHGIDLIRWYTGAEITTVSAFSRTFLPHSSTEDTTMAVLELSSGALCSVFSSRAMPAPPFPGEVTRLRIMGNTGLIDLDAYGELRVADEKGWRVERTQPPVDDDHGAFGDARMQAYCDQIQSFIDGIQGHKMITGKGTDGRAAVSVCMAMLTSARERRWVAPR